MAQGDTSRREAEMMFWNAIWKLDVPIIIKYFIWRACTDILPTMSKLVSRKVTEFEIFPICQSTEESSIHIQWPCPAAIDVWGIEVLAVQKWIANFGEFWDLWLQVVLKLTQNQLEECAIVLKNL